MKTLIALVIAAAALVGCGGGGDESWCTAVAVGPYSEGVAGAAPVSAKAGAAVTASAAVEVPEGESLLVSMSADGSPIVSALVTGGHPSGAALITIAGVAPRDSAITFTAVSVAPGFGSKIEDIRVSASECR